MKTILFASHSATLTGAPQMLYTIVSNLDNTRFIPLVLFPSDGPMVAKFRRAGFEPEIINIGESDFSANHIPLIKAFCLARKIDLIHANTIRCFPFPVAASELGIPCIWHIHEMFAEKEMYEVDQMDLRWSIMKAWKIAMISSQSQREFADYCKELEIAQPETVIVRNGVDVPETFAPFSRSPSDEIEIVSLGRYTRRKGLEYLVDAFKLVSDEAKSARLTMVGEVGSFPYFLELYEKAERLDILEKVNLMNVVEDTDPVFQSADIVVNAALMENLPLVVAEAMAYGKAVVATDVGGTRELITHGENGLLVPRKDAKALADAILSFIENPSFAKTCGEKARKRIIEAFSIDKMTADFQELYLSAPAPSEMFETSTQKDAVVYELLSDALISIYENFSRMDKQITTHDNVIAKDHVEIKKSGERIEYLSQYTSNVERDIRTLETVVNSLLQKLPFRLFRKLKALLTPKRQG